jgi:hypothetical protein
MTKSTAMAADITALLRARNPLLWVVTREEGRVEGYLAEAAAAAGYVPRTWDVAQGVADLAGKRQAQMGSADPGDTLGFISERTGERGVWIMRDLPAWLEGAVGATTQRALRNLARKLPGAARADAQAIIVLTPRSTVPAELAGHATVIEWPLPDRDEIARILDAAIEALPDELQAAAAPNGTREQAIDAAVGLTGEEAAACYARSLVQTRTIDPALVGGEKRRVIAREKVLEWFEPLAGGLDAVGGLDLLKGWLAQRRLAYSPAARAYGLPSPKGALLVGVPGTGKSLTAKAVATAWGVPLLRLDLGALRSKFVGESEGNLRKALEVIESVGRCVVWLDEIEKALAGATQGAADGGVSADALGTVLSWMQERQGQAFVVATANDATSLPPELLRKGRFDEVWWIDLPTSTERADIVLASLRAYGRDGTVFASTSDIGAVVEATEGFTGSEIAALVPEALFAAFADGERAVTVADLMAAAGTVVPLSRTAAEKIEKLRSWAQGRARSATSVEKAPEGTVARGRAIDL